MIAFEDLRASPGTSTSTSRRVPRGDQVMGQTELSLCFSFEGSFRVEDAVRAAGQLEGTAHGSLVRLDFTHCDNVDAGGVARLVESVALAGGVLRLRGLTRHDLRILQYLMGPSGEAPGESLDVD
ncbi:MAG: hypothetical protein NDI82_03525 [Anaeromyxobacteraceae bacterium]|nr:hypothetical protein [Anaeromyxobacteraceae bacterium]